MAEKTGCSRFSEELVGIAIGEEHPEALEHLKKCPNCSEKLEQFKRIVGTAKISRFDAPEDVIEKAKDIFQQRTAQRAQLVSSTLAMEGIRAAHQGSFQNIYSWDDHRMRVMYVKTEKGWEVISSLPSKEWQVKVRGKRIEPDEALRISFLAKELKQTTFTLEGPGITVEIPAPSVENNERQRSG
ncbi:MAG TPA: hypothetical protein VNK96_00145 [Fimbriimonadales bacterium]|nr:hypothetical protein [Fimbriimonadales bacterium]